MNVYLDSIGCRLNQSEIETMARQFRVAGHTLVASPEEADLVVVNTCGVTAAAASGSRQRLRQAAKAGAGEIVVTGCWSTLNPQEANALPTVGRVVPNREKDHLVADLLQLPQASFDLEFIPRAPLPGNRMRTRAFIKVQDGCNNHCTYCVTALARGPACSRPIEAVLADIHRAVGNSAEQTLPAAEGCAREVVLTGVHLGSWGQDFSPSRTLSHLLAEILKHSHVPRLRLSSLEPWDLDEKFFSLWQNPRLCRHLHLPLQSGSTATLRRMARKTTPQAFARLLEQARHLIPQVAITTDIMVGFPGETDQEFNDSLSFVNEMGFAGGHVFTYSARPGTAAARFPDQVPPPVRRERNTGMRQALAESARSYRLQFLGKVLPVLWESCIAQEAPGWELSGLTDNYLRVKVRSPQPRWNQISNARLLSVRGAEMLGDLDGSGGANDIP